MGGGGGRGIDVVVPNGGFIFRQINFINLGIHPVLVLCHNTVQRRHTHCRPAGWSRWRSDHSLGRDREEKVCSPVHCQQLLAVCILIDSSRACCSVGYIPRTRPSAHSGVDKRLGILLPVLLRSTQHRRIVTCLSVPSWFTCSPA